MHIELINITLFEEDSFVSSLLIIMCRSLNKDVSMSCHYIDEVVVMLSVADYEREVLPIKTRQYGMICKEEWNDFLLHNIPILDEK